MSLYKIILMNLQLIVFYILRFISSSDTEASSALHKKDALICPPGCSSCSTLNGCLACKQRYFLLLVRSGMRQTGVCTLTCPSGYYGVRRKDFSVCLSKIYSSVIG